MIKINEKEIFKKIYKEIKKYNTIVIARHIGPDPDAIGSQVALRDSIKLTFPKKKVYAVGNPVAKFKYIGSLDKIDDSLLEDPLLIVLDLPNIERLDGVKINNYKSVIKIDHHPFEETMGEIEFIKESASSTCEIIIDLINNTNLKMNKEIASNLFIGAVADSDRFLLPTTTSETFHAIGNLIKLYDLDLKTLYNNLYERPLSEVKYQAYITSNMTITENGFAYIKLIEETMDEYKVDASSASNMINDFNYIKGIYAWAFSSYDEKQELYKINIRSRGPIINDIAQKYNGGGHKYASGARLETEEEVDKLFKELDDACLKYNEDQKIKP